MKNALLTGFDIFYPVKNTVKVHRVFTGFFTGFCMGSDPVKNALFTGFDIFYHVKNTESSQVFKRFFTGPFTGFFRGEKLTGFFTRFCMGSDPVKNALFTGFDIFYHVKNTESSQVLKRFFTRPFTGLFRGEKLTGFCMGSDLVKNALFTGSQQFHTL